MNVVHILAFSLLFIAVMIEGKKEKDTTTRPTTTTLPTTSTTTRTSTTTLPRTSTTTRTTTTTLPTTRTTTRPTTTNLPTTSTTTRTTTTTLPRTSTTTRTTTTTLPTTRTTTRTTTTTLPTTSTTTKAPSTSAVITTTYVSIQCLTNFRTSMFLRHNEVRALHGAPDMVSNATYHYSAQQVANYQAATGNFSHSYWPKVGENLAFYMKTGTKDDNATCYQMGITMTNWWYNEIAQYDYNNPGFSGTTGHFTQVIWKSSTQLGVGLGIRNKNSTLQFFGVAHYYKAGNVIGQFPTQVLPLL